MKQYPAASSLTGGAECVSLGTHTSHFQQSWEHVWAWGLAYSAAASMSIDPR